MKKVFLLVTLMVLGSACVKRVDGTLNTSEDLAFNGKNGQVTVSAGTHTATLKLKKKKKFTLVVNDNGSQKKVLFNVPKGITIPRNGGRLRLSAAEAGQPFDVAADIKTDVSSSEPRHSTESCSQTIYRDEVYWVTIPGRTIPGSCTVRNGRRICTPPRTIPPRRERRVRRVRRTVYGYRDITFRILGETTTFDFTLYSAEDQAPVADFKGYEYDSQRQILSRGHCRIRGIPVVGPGPVVIR